MERVRAEPTTERGVARLVLLTAREQRAWFERRFAAFGLTMQQAGVLARCGVFAEVSPARIAGFLGTDTAAMTRLIDQLEERGLVTRKPHPRDRRSILLEPTPPGRALLPRLRRIFMQAERTFLSGFTSSEAEQLRALLARMIENARPEHET